MSLKTHVFACASLAACALSAQVETWRVAELEFTAAADYGAAGGDAVRFDAAFSNRVTGTCLSRPGFWDGGTRFLVRFAAPEPGDWDWTTASQDAGLDGRKGTLAVVPYAGKLDVYRHGFLKTVPGKKHFVHADGTPFFYLGDTHWGLYKEEIDEPGPHAGATGAKSHFKYIVDRRAEQGFTVYQSEPIGAKFNLEDGRVDASDIPGLRLADRYYRHIADAGLVHANACFFFAAGMNEKLAQDEAALARLSRYWAARFGAYPVLWTLAQEIDNDFYSERGAHPFYNYSNNPWVKVAEYLHGADAYSHPLSGHQENTGATTVTGRGTQADKSKISGNGASVFADAAVTARTGHSWWAAQWSPNLTARMDFQVPCDYWTSPKPAVNYEGRYCGLWTKDTGARAQGWIAFLTGFCGYGYGAIDMWLYLSTYDVKSTSRDGVDVITPEDKAQPWSASLEYPSALQMGYMKKFLTSFDWWNLKPDLASTTFYDLRNVIGVHAVAGTRHVFYFYGKSRESGPVKGLDADALYTLRWFNPRTGAYLPETLVHPDEYGTFWLPARPDEEDWVLELMPCPSVMVTADKPVVLDFGPQGVGGYPVLDVVEGAGTLRASYATHPDGLGEKGDFWRETSARYLGPDVDLPILPANIDRYEFFAVTNRGACRARLLQGLVRYVRLQVEGGTGAVKLRHFGFANDKVHAQGERMGRFDCSDPQLAALWEASVRTCELSAIPSYDSAWGPRPVKTLPYLADGAKRDRLVWSGDLWWAQRNCYYGFRPDAPYMRGSVRMLAANQTPEGYVQASPWPDQPPPKAGEWGPFGSDEFACWFVPVVRDHYLHTADRGPVRETFPAVQRLMDYLARHQNPETGIFEQRKETCKHAAGLVFGGTSLHHRAFMNILLWKTYVDAAALADAVDAKEDAARWRAAARVLERSVRTAFWDGEKGHFRLSVEEPVLGFDANALALATRFATDEEAARIMRQLVQVKHGKFQALAARGKFEYGAADAAIRAIDAHGWRSVLDPDWAGVRLTSECMKPRRTGWGDEAHPDTAVAGLLTNYILGIRPVEPGFAAFEFRVPATQRISWASGQVPTPHGTIWCSWLKKNGGVQVNVSVPPGTRCRISVPGDEPLEAGPGAFSRLFAQ